MGQRCTSWSASDLGDPPEITSEVVFKALGKMKSGKAAGPPGIIVEMLKSVGRKGMEVLRQLFSSVIKDGKISEDWEMSYILNNVLRCNAYTYSNVPNKRTGF